MLAGRSRCRMSNAASPMPAHGGTHSLHRPTFLNRRATRRPSALQRKHAHTRTRVRKSGSRRPPLPYRRNSPGSRNRSTVTSSAGVSARFDRQSSSSAAASRSPCPLAATVAVAVASALPVAACRACRPCHSRRRGAEQSTSSRCCSDAYETLSRRDGPGAVARERRPSRRPAAPPRGRAASLASAGRHCVARPGCHRPPGTRRADHAERSRTTSPVSGSTTAMYGSAVTLYRRQNVRLARTVQQRNKPSRMASCGLLGPQVLFSTWQANTSTACTF